MTPAKRQPKQKSQTLSTVDAPQADRPPRWTVMVFMGAAKIDGSEPLGDAADADLAEIGAVGGGGDHDLNIFVQLHGQGEPRRYHFGAERTDEAVPASALDFQNGQALADFIEYSTSKIGHRRKDHSILVMWGHAFDFAFGRSLTPGGAIAALDFVEISEVLRRLQMKMLKRYEDHEPGEPPTLDIIGFDACDIATVEMAHQLKSYAKFLLGSQTGIPIPGWPYNLILDRLKSPHGDLMAPPEFGSYAVRRFCASYDPSSPVTLTLINLTHEPQLFELADAFALELSIAAGNPRIRDLIADLFFESQTERGKPFVDVADLCLNLLSATEYPSLVRRARQLGDLIAGPCGNAVGLSKEGAGWPLVAEHGRNSGQLTRLNGLSLYAPHLAPPEDLSGVRKLYERFAFVQNTRWSNLVHGLAKLG